MTICGHTMTTGPCTLDAGHRGRHTTASFYCDACGRRRRGVAHAVDGDGNGVCWFCCHVPDKCAGWC